MSTPPFPPHEGPRWPASLQGEAQLPFSLQRRQGVGGNGRAYKEASSLPSLSATAAATLPSPTLTKPASPVPRRRRRRRGGEGGQLLPPSCQPLATTPAKPPSPFLIQPDRDETYSSCAHLPHPALTNQKGKLEPGVINRQQSGGGGDI